MFLEPNTRSHFPKENFINNLKLTFCYEKYGGDIGLRWFHKSTCSFVHITFWHLMNSKYIFVKNWSFLSWGPELMHFPKNSCLWVLRLHTVRYNATLKYWVWIFQEESLADVVCGNIIEHRYEDSTNTKKIVTRYNK